MRIIVGLVQETEENEISKITPSNKYTLKKQNFGHSHFGPFNYGQNLSAISSKWIVWS